ncbi:speckle-type POZ protein [Rhipicephalus sanguineus]|uniref:Speckle-type POZ protein n=1 Tax=Rhipicephalus sanguineus TaxID=34632 RepID=A0A9D4Q853_RHISA|nr:speckle-type POZ protein [Rhipicephalus sanguineus]KAH7969700.1 hypothetical protein HPB52_021582 [Rhipicephalus sanguineus]
MDHHHCHCHDEYRSLGASNEDTPQAVAGATSERATSSMDSGDVPVPSRLGKSVITNPVEQRSCFTDQKMVKISFLWTITNFSLCRQSTAQALLSSTFSAGEYKPTTWRLRLYPRGVSESCEDYVALYLVSYNTRCVSAKARFSIVDVRKDETNTRQTRTRTFSRRGDNWGFAKFVGRMSLKQNAGNLLPNDTLTVKCEITALESSTCTPGTSSAIASTTPLECRLSQDLEWLLESKNYADVTFKVGDETFQAHRGILAARSLAFRLMLEHPLEEAAPREVIVKDVEPEVFAVILSFLYTGRVPDPLVKPKALLKAASLYDINVLKEACQLALIFLLSAESAADTLILAEQCNAVTLRSSALDFIRSNINAVVETPGWDTLCKSHAELLEEISPSLTNKTQPPAKRSRSL